MSAQLQPEIDSNQAKRIFEVLADDLEIFKEFTNAEVDAISQIFQLFTYKQ